MKMIKELGWIVVGTAGWTGMDLAGDYINWSPSILWAAPLFGICMTAMIVGIRRGFPDGIWGIK